MEIKINIRKSIINKDSLPGIILLLATIVALIFANTELSVLYNKVLYEIKVSEEFNLHFFINDFLMAIFFLTVGFEIKRELLYGKLSSIKQASFPVVAAIGGMVVPALIFTLFNFNSYLEIGVGIPLSTDIAFAIGVFSFLKGKLGKSLELFLLTLAVVDDLLSIVIIGVFYSSGIRISGIIISLIIIAIIILVKKIKKLNSITVYLILGFLLWCSVFYSGIHSTLSGVILAFCMPMYDKDEKDKDLSYKLQHKLEGISNYLILPLFAFANTGISLMGSLNLSRDYTLMLGIILGLVIGKPLGIMFFGYVGDKLKVANKVEGASWYEVFIVSVIAGIGFTMSLFISEIAFKNEEMEINVAKISILIAALISTVLAIILSSIKKSNNRI